MNMDYWPQPWYVSHIDIRNWLSDFFFFLRSVKEWKLVRSPIMWLENYQKEIEKLFQGTLILSDCQLSEQIQFRTELQFCIVLDHVSLSLLQWKQLHRCCHNIKIYSLAKELSHNCKKQMASFCHEQFLFKEEILFPAFGSNQTMFEDRFFTDGITRMYFGLFPIKYCCGT